ncbi:MAG: DUF3791 domain-containing protein [Clostridia bacterium]|nr:DUF3791 domain-containing protein [Clostridia bacterium]
MKMNLSDECQFAIAMFEEYKYIKGISGKEALKLFDKYGLYSYLVDSYPYLHIFGSRYIVMDMDDYMKKCDAKAC